MHNVPTGVLFIHTHTEFGGHISLGWLLQPPLHELAAHLLGAVLTAPKIIASVKTEPSAQLGIGAPLAEAMSVHKKTPGFGSGSLTDTRQRAHKEAMGCPNSWTRY